MKATDLMIGDWVVGCSGEPFKIGIIDPDFLHWNEIQPIPLTQEILEKNGFKPYIPENHLETVYACQDISKAVADELYALWPYCDGSFYLLLRVDGKDMVRMDVHYVHQLQHALRLCGIEKEIDL